MSTLEESVPTVPIVSPVSTQSETMTRSSNRPLLNTFCLLSILFVNFDIVD